MYCNHCGKNLEPGTVCCPYCGQKAESLSGGTGFWDLTDEPRSQTPQQQAAQPAPPAPPAPPVRPAASRPEAPEQKQPNGTQPQAGNNLLAVVAAVLAAGALILGAVNLVQVKKLQKNVRELAAARQTEQSAGENMPEPSAMPTVTPEEVTPAETMTPAVSEEPTPTVSPETEASTAETTSPAVSPNAVAENQSNYKVTLGSEDREKPAVRYENGALTLYFYADGVDEEDKENIKWWKLPTDPNVERNEKNWLELQTKQDDGTWKQSGEVEENIVLTAKNDFVIFFTIGDSKEPSQSISVLENKLLTVKENNKVLSYEAIKGFKDLVNYYTIVWEIYDESEDEWEEAGEEAGTNETLTLTEENGNKRIRAAVYSDVNKKEGSLVGYTEWKNGANS